MIKGIFSTFLLGASMAAGYMAGTEIYIALRDPCERAKLKNKFGKVKDAFTSKEES